MSIDWIFQDIIEPTTKTSLKLSLSQVGESFFIAEESSSKPLATKRALSFFYPHIIICYLHLKPTGFGLIYNTLPHAQNPIKYHKTLVNINIFKVLKLPPRWWCHLARLGINTPPLAAADHSSVLCQTKHYSHMNNVIILWLCMKL